jgi:hypothetical protein
MQALEVDANSSAMRAQSSPENTPASKPRSVQRNAIAAATIELDKATSHWKRNREETVSPVSMHHQHYDGV